VEIVQGQQENRSKPIQGKNDCKTGKQHKKTIQGMKMQQRPEQNRSQAVTNFSTANLEGKTCCREVLVLVVNNVLLWAYGSCVPWLA
jgi:hypothetical protein